MNAAQRRILSRALLLLGGTGAALVMLVVGGHIYTGGSANDDVVKYGILYPAAVAFISITAGLFVRAGGKSN